MAGDLVSPPKKIKILMSESFYNLVKFEAIWRFFLKQILAGEPGTPVSERVNALKIHIHKSVESNVWKRYGCHLHVEIKYESNTIT